MSVVKANSFNPVRHGKGHIVCAADSFVCCESIREFGKVSFSDSS